MSDYIPPLRRHFLARFYDPVARLTTRESSFKQALLAQVVANRPRDVLDQASRTVNLCITRGRPVTG